MEFRLFAIILRQSQKQDLVVEIAIKAKDICDLSINEIGTAMPIFYQLCCWWSFCHVVMLSLLRTSNNATLSLPPFDLPLHFVRGT